MGSSVVEHWVRNREKLGLKPAIKANSCSCMSFLAQRNKHWYQSAWLQLCCLVACHINSVSINFCTTPDSWFILLPGVKPQLPWECSPARHTVITGEWKRSAAHKISLEDYAFCDFGGYGGWYVFSSFIICQVSGVGRQALTYILSPCLSVSQGDSLGNSACTSCPIEKVTLWVNLLLLKSGFVTDEGVVKEKV